MSAAIPLSTSTEPVPHLQVLLETLFSRLQSQANLFNDLTRRVSYIPHGSLSFALRIHAVAWPDAAMSSSQVERMEAKEIDGQELLQRVQLCEGKLSEFTESKLSPFNQQDIMARVEELEQQVGGQRAAAAAVAAAVAAAEAAAAKAEAEAPVIPEVAAEPSKALLGEVRTSFARHVIMTSAARGFLPLQPAL